jgi:hypothetical protein
MPVPEDRLRDLSALEVQADGVRRAVDDLLAAAHDPESPLRVRDGVDRLDGAVNSWLEATASIEVRLLSDAEAATNDRYDAEARLGGLALAQLSVAEDVATVAPLDEISLDEPTSAVQERVPGATDSSREVLVEGGLLRILSEPIDPEDERSPIAGASPEDNRIDEHAARVIDEVIDDILERSGRGVVAVATSLVGPVAHVLGHLSDALTATPAQIQTAFEKTARRIAKLVKLLVKRALEIFDSLTGGYGDAAKEFLKEAVWKEIERFGATVMSDLLNAPDVRARAVSRLATAPNPDARLQRVQKMKRQHSRWVGPVRLVAHGIPKLWAVMIGPVPAGAIATVGLLGYTAVVTGDQLDSSRIFVPDLWAGVVRRADGE